MTSQTWTITVGSAPIRIPDQADMVYPNEPFIVYFLVAQDEDGNRRREPEIFDTAEQAEAYIPDAPPIEEWDKQEPAYGTTAWLAWRNAA